MKYANKSTYICRYIIHNILTYIIHSFCLFVQCYTKYYLYFVEEWEQELQELLDQLAELLSGDEHLSAYELQSSGLAPALLQVLTSQSNGNNNYFYFMIKIRFV